MKNKRRAVFLQTNPTKHLRTKELLYDTQLTCGHWVIRKQCKTTFCPFCSDPDYKPNIIGTAYEY